MTPFAKRLFEIAQPLTPQDLEDMGGESVWRFSEKPVTLPTAPPKEIQSELDRLRKPEWRGRPHE